MILVNLLRPFHATIQRRGIILRNPDNCLQEEEDVSDEAEFSVNGGEVRGAVGEFVVFDDYEGGEEGEGGEGV